MDVRSQSEPHGGGAACAAERRETGRIRPAGLSSSVGPVIDLSSGGMRVLTKRSMRGDLLVRVTSDLGDELEVRARVIWCRRVGFRRHVTGLSFVDLTPAAARVVARMGNDVASSLID